MIEWIDVEDRPPSHMQIGWDWWRQSLAAPYDAADLTSRVPDKLLAGTSGYLPAYDTFDTRQEAEQALAEALAELNMTAEESL